MAMINTKMAPLGSYGTSMQLFGQAPPPTPPLEGRGAADAQGRTSIPLPCRGGVGVESVTQSIIPCHLRYKNYIIMHYNTAKAHVASQKDQRRSLRSNMTPAEATLWRALKGRGAGGLKFRRQQGIGPYVLDFYCPERRLCVEVDGSSHDYRFDYDEQRTQFLAEQGIRVIRFCNELVLTCLDGVVAEIVRAAGEVQTPPLTPPLVGAGSG